jgi:hypothetical protein
MSWISAAWSWINAVWGWYVANSGTVNPIVAGLGGAALVWAAVRQARTATNRHYEQTRADQQRRLTESFSKAVEQLASDKIEARLGGIYTLERLALEAIAQVRSPSWWRRLRRNRATLPADPVTDLYWTVMETLTAFVRERAKWQQPEAGSEEIYPRPPTDIAAVLTVVRRRPEAGRAREQQRDWRLDLHATDLRGAFLPWAHLERAILVGAHLGGASLHGAHLEGAVIHGARLEYTSLIGAHLEGADLHGVLLDGANLRGAHLEGANLLGAQLDDQTLNGRPHGDARTRLPDEVVRPPHWPAYEPDTVTFIDLAGGFHGRFGRGEFQQEPVPRGRLRRAWDGWRGR